VTIDRFDSEPEWIAAALGELGVAVESATALGRSSLSLCLAGGRTPEGAYRAMAALPLRGVAVDLWLGDERLVGAEDPGRNGRMVEGAFSSCAWDPLPRLHQWPFAEALPAGAGAIAEAYAAELSASLGPRPAFDLSLLGLGADGHTASLFPGSPLLDDAPGSAFSPLAAACASPVAPFDRLTLTLAALIPARRIVFLVRGRDKLDALRRLEEGDPGIPASRLAGRARVLYLL
jgi:6-phosphogluconolactonase